MNKGLLATLLALSFAVAPLTAYAQKHAPVTNYAATETPFKLVRPSAKLAEDAPSLTWTDPSKKPNVALLCIHGLGLHKGNYEAFGKEMSKYGIAVTAIDMRGFGEWRDSGKHAQIDFDGSLADIEAALKKLHAQYPGVPVVIVGESMGGSIALRATALYPDQIAGLISSVPSGDRYNEFGQSFKVGMHVLFGGGFNKPMDIGTTIVKQATKKDDLRETWSQDPEGKMMLTPNELLHFQKLMKENFEAAKTIKTAPVLFIQGVSDKLVRPAGTWQLYDNLGTPNRQLVLSKNGEHLIFEEDQFSKDDLLFVRTWINKNVVKLDPSAIASDKQEPAVANSLPGPDAPSYSAPDKLIVVPDKVATVPNRPDTEATLAVGKDGKKPAAKKPDQVSVSIMAPGKRGTTISESIGGLNYWIELMRAGKSYRCNNKTAFKSGDSIRFHVIPEDNGFAYVFMKASSTGKKAVLFPTPSTGTSNYVEHGKDYALPSKSWLTFDNHPGVERLTLVLSKNKVAADPSMTERYVTAYVSPGMEGSKDLVPTRMQLSWDDPNPVIMPDDFSTSDATSSLVRLRSIETAGVLSIDVALEHD